MPDLSFKVTQARPEPYAASPLLNFLLEITDAEPTVIHSVVLRCQIRIDPARRHYEAVEKQRLLDLFGDTSRWGQTLRPMLWTHASVVVPPFTGQTNVDLPVPCTFDFNVAATKYFDALGDGEVPLSLLFSGTIFHATDHAPVQIAQISWEKEAAFRLPVRVWREMMDLYYPNSAWLCLRKDAFDALHEYKRILSIPTWEAAVAKLLAESDEEVQA